jgi:hypothetical protein
MPTEQTTKATLVVDLDQPRLDLQATHFVPVAIPDNLNQSKNLKADLEAYDIPVHLEIEEAEMDVDQLGGIPVLVPEGTFERASEIVGLLELNALEDDDFEEEEEEDEKEKEEDEEWDDEEEYDDDEDEEEEEEEDEKEDEKEEADDDFDLDDFDDLDEDDDLDAEP